MTSIYAVYDALAAGLVLGWSLFWLLRFFIPVRLAAGVAVGVGFVPFFLFPTFAFYSIFIAVFTPFGLLLPMVAVQGILRVLGYRVTRVATLDLLAILGLYTAFILASVGVFEWDPYRYGYLPASGGAVAVMLCLYGLLRQHIWISAVAVAGQVLWAFDFGSSNYFDHISHVLLIPIIAICLLRRALWVVLAKDPSAEPAPAP